MNADEVKVPEARVDWEKEARELLDALIWENQDNLEWDESAKVVAKALSAAFEKGREAR